LIGTKVGHYFLVRQIGEGGTGAVYLAKHHSLGTRKAVKVLLPKYAQEMSLVWRFQNEAITIARLNHRNIVSVDDFGQLPDGQWYCMMPFLEGISLEVLLQRHAPLPLHQSLHIVSQICAALQAAHAAGVIHRDLKPANVFLTSGAEDPWHVTLLDFGIAKLLGAEASEFSTDKNAAFGTPAFMAAEVIENATQASVRSDVFSLGVLVYRMVTGAYPFGVHPAAVLYRMQMNQRPPRPQGIPSAWADVILRALARRPEDRPESAGELAIALAAATPAALPRFPAGADILTAVARELVIPGSGPVAVPSAAARSLSEQIRSPLWPPAPPPPKASPTVRADPVDLCALTVLTGDGALVTTTTLPPLRLRELRLWDLMLHPARTQRRLVMWAITAVIAASIIAALCR
jgi:serine/threonine-protein kinase